MLYSFTHMATVGVKGLISPALYWIRNSKDNWLRFHR